MPLIKFIKKYFPSLGVLFLSVCLACEKTSQNDRQSENSNLADSMAKGLDKADTLVEDFDFKAERLKLIIEGYFAKYQTREFLALKDYYAPTITRFIHLKNIPAKRVSEEARKYFDRKTGVGFYPLMDEMLLDIRGNHCTAKVKVNINWSVESNPRDTVTSEGLEMEIFEIETFSAPVIVELIFNEKYKIVSYQELEIVREKINLKNGLTATNSQGKAKINIPANTWIEKGEFYKFTGSLDYGSVGANIQQKIYYNKEAYWIDQQALYEGQ
ncbi:MAG: hypothetical protein NW226_15285 [Microscillaceae bacterium]|nr:hypothetical protein [Microscillaceae bacterium]